MTPAPQKIDGCWTIPVCITCTYCKTQYHGFQQLNKRQFDNHPRHWRTEYCPSCPPVLIEDWMVKHCQVDMVEPEEYRAELRRTLSTTVQTVRKVTSLDSVPDLDFDID